MNYPHKNSLPRTYYKHPGRVQKYLCMPIYMAHIILTQTHYPHLVSEHYSTMIETTVWVTEFMVMKYNAYACPLNTTVDINFYPVYRGNQNLCYWTIFFSTYVATPILSPTTKILVAANELVNALKQTSTLFTTSTSSDHLSALKKLATIFETASSSLLFPNTKNIPRPASVQMVPIYVPQPPTQQFARYSTAVPPNPEPPAYTDIPAPMTIPYNES